MISIFKDKQGRSKIPLGRSGLFWMGIAIKLLLSVCFASGYMRDLFAPFANHYLTDFEDPYSYFMAHGSGNEFPYPPLMLWLFSIPRLLLSPLFPVSEGVFTVADSLIYRIPLLLADFAILLVLMRWLKTHTRQVLIWYWLSPVLIYINYIHGQLDVIPMALMMLSLYFLFRNRWVAAFLLLGFAIASKTNMLMVVPFYMLYMLKNAHVDLKTGISSFAALLFSVVLINLPYINSEGMLQMVYNNPVQKQIFDLYYQFNSSLRILFIPSVYFLLILYYLSFRFVNRDQLILFLAFTFLALTLMIAPMQGWYYWIMPLMVYFIIKQGNREKFVFVLLSAMYFVYFGLIPESDYTSAFNVMPHNSNTVSETLSESGKQWLNIAFTLLQTTLALAGFLVYKSGISSNIQAKFLSQPYLIGIGGDSGSGKSTLSNALSDVFESRNTGIIRGDDMHKWERGHENWKRFTHLDPKANKLHEDLEHARHLKSGKGVKRRNYDHNTGRFTLPKFIRPNKLIIFEGLHSFYLSNQAAVYDLKIFMEPDENLRMWWKVKRDVAKRGYTPQAVLDQLKHRETDSEKYIRTQASQADIIAKFYPLKPLDPVEQSIAPEIGLSITVSNELNLERLIERLSACPTLVFEHQYRDDTQEVFLRGTISGEQIDFIASDFIPELEEIGVYNAVWKPDYEGLLQLFTVYVIFEKLKLNEQLH